MIHWSMEGIGYAGNHYVGMHRMQGAQLLDDEEQEDCYWPSGVEEVLQTLPQASGA
jgi:hypothetical protein